MPCRDWDETVRYETVYRDRPETIEMLCSALRSLEALGQGVPPNCVNWWRAHKKEDEARRAAEKAKLVKAAKRKAILSKLSAEEKKILGL